MQYGCPVKCRYCIVTNIDKRKKKWREKHRFGINKTVLFINRLPDDPPLKKLEIPKEIYEGEYIGFQGITDAFWDIFIDDLAYMINKTYETKMKKLVIATKYSISKEQKKILNNANKKKLLIAVSLTGLDMIEELPTKERLNTILFAKENNIDVLPLIHPYIHGLSDLSFLKDLASIGINKVAVKGFRYSKKYMSSWGEKLIPKDSLLLYKKLEEKEVMIGSKYVLEKLEKYNLEYVNFRQYVHRDNQVPGISKERAAEIVNKIFPLCVVSSSDTSENVKKVAIKRRL